MPTVSVVIPVHNREDVVERAVASVLRQTCRDLEVIAVDDASTDATRDVLAAIDDPRFRFVLLDENRGPSGARNAGVAEAGADWIAFQDSDDEWLPEKLDRQFAALARYGSDAVGCFCGMLVLDRPEGGGLPIEPSYWPRPRFGVPLEGKLQFSLLRSGSLISTQTFLGRRDAFLAAGGFDEDIRFMEDWEGFIRISAQGPFAFEPEPLVLQRFSSNSLTRSGPNRARALAQVLTKHERTYRAHGLAKILAINCLYVAGGLSRAGDAAGARAWLLRSLRIDPLSPRLWGRAALLAGRSLIDRVGRLVSRA